jgi:hypothetical protein
MQSANFIPIEFVTGRNNNTNHRKQPNLYVPLLDVGYNPADEMPPIPTGMKNEISKYYENKTVVTLPSDVFIRSYYSSLALIGLYVVFRLIMPGR